MQFYREIWAKALIYNNYSNEILFNQTKINSYQYPAIKYSKMMDKYPTQSI